MIEYLPPLADLATALTEPVAFLGDEEGKEKLGESAARCVMNLLRLITPEKLDELILSIPGTPAKCPLVQFINCLTAREGRRMLRGLITVMHTHLSTLSQSAPTLRHSAMTSLLFFLQPLTSHLDLFQTPDTGTNNRTEATEN